MIEAGTETSEVIAREAICEERDEIFYRQRPRSRSLRYEREAGGRVIPVVVSGGTGAPASTLSRP